jgi:hypothetical protein
MKFWKVINGNGPGKTLARAPSRTDQIDRGAYSSVLLV